jgi:hypothetical protein
LGFVVICAMQIPGGAVFHRMTPTPERLNAAIIAALALIPFFAGSVYSGQAPILFLSCWLSRRGSDGPPR